MSPRVSEIAEAASRLQVATTTASRLCDQAVKGGYLIKATSAKDARQRVLTLTTQGHQLRLESETFRHGYLRRILEDWTNDDINAFTALLSRFASTVAAHPPPRAASAPRG